MSERLDPETGEPIVIPTLRLHGVRVGIARHFLTDFVTVRIDGKRVGGIVFDQPDLRDKHC